MKKRLLTAMIIAALVGTATMPVLADEKYSNNDKTEQIIVTAERNKDHNDNKDNEEPVYSRTAVPESSKAATQIFTRADIEAMHPKNVFDIIEQGLGIAEQYQGRKGFDLPQDRGGDSIGIIFDGIYMPLAQYSRMLANFPVEEIESVKIVRDSTVVTLGPLPAFTSTLGSPNQGFIIITTRKPSRTENELSASYGSFNTEKLNIFHGDKINDFYYEAAYAKSRTGGKDNWNNASDSNSFYLKGGYAGPKLNYNLSLYVNRAMRQFERDVKNNTMSDYYWKYDPLNTVMVSFDIAKPWNTHNTTAFSFGYTNINDTNVYKEHPTTPLQKSAERDYVREYNLWHTISSPKNTFKLGGQAIVWDTPTGEFYYDDFERAEELYGYYIYDEYKVNNRLTVDGGARIDKKHITRGTLKLSPKNLVGNLGNDYLEDKWAKNAVSYSLGAAYKLNPVYKLSTRFSYSRQPMDDFLHTVNDEKFAPERRFKYELGITANYSRAFNAGLTAFYYDIDNCKVVITTVGTGVNATNIFDSYDLGRKGLELSLNGQLTKSLHYNLGYSYFTSSNSTDSANNPHNIYTIKLANKGKKFDTNLTLLKVGPYKSNNVGVGDFTIINVNISKPLDARRSITIFGDNITNCHYTTRYNNGLFYDVGAVYGLEINWKF